MTAKAITVSEAAIRLSVSERTVWRAIKNGRLARVEGIGRAVRVSESAVEQLINPPATAAADRSKSIAAHPASGTNVVTLPSGRRPRTMRKPA